MTWQRLLVESDDDVEQDMDRLSRETKEALLAAIERYASEGVGSVVAYSPRGSLQQDALHADGMEVRFFIDPDGQNGPTMVLSEICATPGDTPDADD
jgi:hypothetical protein